jgi:hypothetical protein
MPEYLESRCCMCPQRGSSSNVCPGITETSHPNETPCRFVKRYEDKLYTSYFVRAGIGKVYKTFWQLAGKKKEQGWRCVPWRSTFDEAQADLNREAEKRKWEEV